MDELRVKIDGKEHALQVEELSHGKLRVHFKGEMYDVETADELPFLSQKKSDKESKKGVVEAPLPGMVSDVRIKSGDKVNKGDVLVTVVAMKMENEIISPKFGIVKDVRIKKNQNVKKGDILLIIE